MTGAGFALALSCASCTDLALHRYRDDSFVREYRYALGEQYIQVNGSRLCYQDLDPRGLPVNDSSATAGPQSDLGNRKPPLTAGGGDTSGSNRSPRSPSRNPETILIIPGLGTSIDYWQLVIPELARHYRVVAVDPPGFGKSDKPDVSYELPWIVEQIVAFMDARQIDRATLMGASLGGHLAMLLAIEHPERVERLVLMGSCGAWPEPGILARIGLVTIWQDPVVIDHLRRNWPKIYSDIVSSDTEVSRRLFQHQMAVMADLKAYYPAGRAASRALKSIFYHSCRSRMHQVQQPALLIWGDSDQIHLLSEAAYLRKHLPRARLAIVPDSAHQVILDQPGRFSELVLRFMRSGLEAIEDSPLARTIHSP